MFIETTHANLIVLLAESHGVCSLMQCHLSLNISIPKIWYQDRNQLSTEWFQSCYFISKQPSTLSFASESITNQLKILDHFPQMIWKPRNITHFKSSWVCCEAGLLIQTSVPVSQSFRSAVIYCLTFFSLFLLNKLDSQTCFQRCKSRSAQIFSHTLTKHIALFRHVILTRYKRQIK